MAGTSLFFDIFGRDNGVGSMFDHIGDKAKGLNPVFEAVAGSVGKLVAPLAAAFAVEKIGEFGKESVSAFSELEDSTAAAGVVFGDSMGQIIDQSKNAATQFGMSSQEVINAANTFGTYGKSAGLAGNDLSGFSTKMTSLAGDMASFKGTSPEQAVEAIGAALRGETEPIRAYGVLLDDASMRNEALKMGLISTTKDALTPQQKVLAAQSLILKQTTDAQGDFARTSTSTANVQKTLAAATENLHAKVGTLLAPAFTLARRSALSFTQGVSGALDAIIPGVTKMWDAVAKIYDGFQKRTGEIKANFAAGWKMPKLEAALIGKDLDPIVAAGLKVRAMFDGLRAPVVNFMDGFKNGVDGINSNQSTLAHWGSATYSAFHTASVAAQVFFDGVGTGVSRAGNGWLSKFAEAGNAVHQAFGVAKEGAGVFFDGLKTGANSSEGGVDGLAGKIGNSLHGAFWDAHEAAGLFFNGIKTGAAGEGSSPIVALAGQLGAAWHNLFTAIGPMLPQILGLVSAFNPLSLLFHAFAPVLPQLATLLGQLAATLSGALGSALTQIMPALQGAASALVGAFGQAVGMILPALVQLLPTLVGAMMSLIPAVMQVISAVVPMIGQILPALVQVFTALLPPILQIVTSVMPMLVQILGVVIAAIGPLVQILVAVLVPAITALLPVVTVIFGAVAQIITAVMQIIQGVIQVVTGLITGNWSMVWEGILNIFSGIWNTIIAVVVGVFATLGSLVLAGLQFIGTITMNILGGIGSFFADTWSNILAGASGFIDGFLGFFRDLPGQIGGFLSGAGHWLFDAGKNIIDGLISGVQSMIGAIGNAILSLVPGPIVGVFKDALGIHSPSRVFAGFGVNIGEGLINGVSAMVPAIDARMGSLVKPLDVPGIVSGSQVLPSAALAGVGGGQNSGSGLNTARPGLTIEHITVNEAQTGGWKQLGNNILQSVQVQAPRALV